MSTTTAAAPTTRQRRRAHAEFMQIWEEGYVSNRISFENMHTPGVFIVEGAALRQHDGRLDRVRVLAYIEATIASNPVFRLRLQRPLLGLTPPAWVPDDDFDLSRHVLFADAPADLATADLRRLAGVDDGVMPLRHPLWRMRVTELDDGRVAIGSMLHHASLDGLSGMRVMSGITASAADDPLPAPVDPFADVRPARTWELPVLALTQWWERLGEHTLAAAWLSYRAKPFARRLRRVAARLTLPLRYRAGGESARRAALPPVHSAYRRLDAAATGRRARELGGTLSDLLMAATIAAWEGPQRHVTLRFPVSFHSPDSPHVRNNVRDMQIAGDADAALDDLVASVHAQVARRGSAWDGHPVAGTPLGYTTLLPWVSRPRFFCGGEVLEVLPFPASLGHDLLATAAIVYNGSVFVGANVPRTTDAAAVIARVADAMSGAGASAG